jgi:hypothetical protein
MNDSEKMKIIDDLAILIKKINISNANLGAYKNLLDLFDYDSTKRFLDELKKEFNSTKFRADTTSLENSGSTNITNKVEEKQSIPTLETLVDEILNNNLFVEKINQIIDSRIRDLNRTMNEIKQVIEQKQGDLSNIDKTIQSKNEDSSSTPNISCIGENNSVQFTKQQHTEETLGEKEYNINDHMKEIIKYYNCEPQMNPSWIRLRLENDEEWSNHPQDFISFEEAKKLTLVEVQGNSVLRAIHDEQSYYFLVPVHNTMFDSESLKYNAFEQFFEFTFNVEKKATNLPITLIRPAVIEKTGDSYHLFKPGKIAINN